MFSLSGGALRSNIAAATLQSLIGMGALFLTYRIVIAEVGIAAFGLWSVLLAGASVARLADVSGGSGLARFIAEPPRDGEAKRALAFIHTTLIATFGLMLAGSALVLLIAPAIIRHVSPDNAEALIGLLPVALLVSILLPPLSAALCSAIDGTLHTHLRALIMSISHLILLGSAYGLVKAYGIFGFAAALGLQHLFLIISAWLVLRRLIPGMGWFPWYWSQPVFRESFAFGLKIQVSTLLTLLSDPVTRFFLVYFGGLEAAGIYDLTLRMLAQIRGIFLAGMQPLIPKIASLSHRPAELESFVVKILHITAAVAPVFTVTCIFAAPLCSILILGRIDKQMQLFVALLAAGLGFSFMAQPMQSTALARGIMRWTIFAQIASVVAISTVGSSVGWVIGGTGVVIGQLVGLMLGAGLVLFGNAHTLRMRTTLRQAAPALIGGILAICACAILSLWWR